MEHMHCIVKRIVFNNQDTGFSVISVSTPDEEYLFTIVGSFLSLREDMILNIGGEWNFNEKYGWQFEVVEYEEVLPLTSEGIMRYLSSGLIEGIGPTIAARIVEKFGDETLSILDEHPERLIEVAGIGKKRIAQISKSWQEQSALRNVMIYLQGYGISVNTAYRIFMKFGTNSVNVVKENPYQLINIWGIGFKTADTIAQNIGFDRKSSYRLAGGVEFVLQNSQDSGHCYLPRDLLKEKASTLLELEPDELDSIVDEMTKSGRVISEEPDRIYLPYLYNSEIGTAERIKRLLSKKSRSITTSRILDSVEAAVSITYAEAQKEAIITAVSSKMTIITGGPGTGKTTTVKGIIAVLNASGMKILLAAPTGRAAKRLSETTGEPAQTIHRLLEANPLEGFGRNEENKLKGNVLIIDESSMIDILLMYNLLKAVPDDMSIIMIGDVDQLPPVGPGNVLRDLIHSGVIPVVRLTHIFRQAYGSQIVQNAHRINEGKFPNLKHREDSDFFFIEQNQNDTLADTIIELCTTRLPPFFNVNPMDIQVLSPMRRAEGGVNNLNIRLQQNLNPTTTMVKRGFTEFRLYDKVMQIRNNYTKEIFNGDIGQIVSVNETNGEIDVQFDLPIPVHYTHTELDELELAYAITVHKSQGSEYDIVVLPVSSQHFVMLQRNLLYTGVTRAKRAIILVGTTNAIGIAVKNNHIARRYTGLAERLRELKQK
ncbi:MAG: ATP-dependent RecD-like DNA helicase [Oscillospiraceae bacterium]|nr:ATP-dependent RecD-like DNA helicase [Oscillospiraceae bacterium]